MWEEKGDWGGEEEEEEEEEEGGGGGKSFGVWVGELLRKKKKNKNMCNEKTCGV